VVVPDNESGGYLMLYSGQDSPVLRTGLARGSAADTFHREPADPTTGDTVAFETRSGDNGSRNTIPLERIFDGFAVSGIGMSDLVLDTERGYALLASIGNSYVVVIDVRDDSEPWFDDNYLAVEAVLDARTNSGARGFRSLAVSGDRLYALNDSPESVMIFDLDAVVDDERADYLPEAVVGYLPTPRGVEQDQGADTLASVGPSGLAVRGDRLFVSNFNANSVGVYDLTLGLDGSMVDEIRNLGENPHAVALSPDGSLLAVSLFVGDTSTGTSESEIALIDVDPDSATYLDVVSRIVNR
jgi:DNA-binding beta-propeller fold protein YncE